MKKKTLTSEEITEIEHENNNLSLVTFLPKEEYNSPEAIKAKELEMKHFKEYGV